MAIILYLIPLPPYTKVLLIVCPQNSTLHWSYDKGYLHRFYHSYVFKISPLYKYPIKKSNFKSCWIFVIYIFFVSFQSLLQKILAKGRGQNAIDPEDVEKSKDLESNDLEEDLGDNGDILADSDDTFDDIQVNELNPLQTTLRVSTVYPESQTKVLPGKEETMLEVATIRSPYSFAIEEGMSTRFITVTR